MLQWNNKPKLPSLAKGDGLKIHSRRSSPVRIRSSALTYQIDFFTMFIIWSCIGGEINLLMDNFQLVEFIYASFGAFFGFLLAIFSAQRLDARKKRSELEVIEKDVRAELAEKRGELKDLKDKDTLYINPIKVPYWDSILSSNRLQLLEKGEWLKSVMLTYDLIEDFNQWHIKRTDLLLNPNISGKMFNEHVAIINKAIEGQNDSLVELINGIVPPEDE